MTPNGFTFSMTCIIFRMSSKGTPTEENWPGISSIEEFKSYNFPKYKPQPIINHAPRYCAPFVSRVVFCSHGSVSLLPLLHVHSNCVFSCTGVFLPLAGNPVEHSDGCPLPSPHEPLHSHQPLLQADNKMSLSSFCLL